MEKVKYLAYISNGKELSVSSVDQIVSLEPHDQVIQSDECVCTNKEHISNCEIENVEVEVESKSIKRKYVVEMAYCKECNAYFIPQKSYSFLAKNGKLVHSVKGGICLYEYMQSGDAYEEEKKQLELVERRLNKELDNLPKPVSRYAIDDNCGGLRDLQRQKYTSKKIYEMQDEINRKMAEPYVGRIDVENSDNKKFTYYIGGVEDKMVGGVRVYSSWSDQGTLFRKESEPKGTIDGNTRNVCLRRKIDIKSGKLRGIEDVFSSNSEYAQKGIYDKFLVQVLMTRKKSHQLTDIIATIQKKQNDIIEKACFSNIIVQGCAGSGKTMVMLHRLSYWLYNNKSLSPEKIKILTPNENFNMHIGALHSQLNLGKIDVLSVDQYYLQLLEKYNKSISMCKKVDDEENIEEGFLNYVYGKQFVKKMSRVYSEIIEKYALEDEIKYVDELLEKYELKNDKVNSKSDADIINALAQKINLIGERNKSILSKNDYYNNKLTRIRDEYEKSKEKRDNADRIVNSYETLFFSKISDLIREITTETEDLNKIIEEENINNNIQLEDLKKSMFRIFNR
ncbi:UvrD-helicase domain-containing protein, partial [Eubacterium sp.]|uniref:UvrD-helicase domain-containing protein n=1 Tax=Eubacterium sp. TaxID=142586 RepID=UPI0025CC5E4F